VLNRETTLGRCLESILGQSHRGLEAIVVDDGSEDATSQIARGWAERDPRVRVVTHERRRGAQAARNSGVRAASGEWIAFLDSDDVWLPESLSLRLAAAATSSVPVVHSECVVRRSGSETPVPFGLPHLSGRVYRELLRHPGPMFQSLLVRRFVLEEIGRLDERIVSFQEWDTAIRLARAAPFAFVDEPTFVYDCTRADSISRDLERTAVGYGMVVSKHVRAIVAHLGLRGLSDHWETLRVLYRTAGDARRARTFWVAASLARPLRPGSIFRRFGARLLHRSGGETPAG
jgi:glycosyltransferase involved in cell wall biosynthesis